jgi:hypothetical protein
MDNFNQNHLLLLRLHDQLELQLLRLARNNVQKPFSDSDDFHPRHGGIYFNALLKFNFLIKVGNFLVFLTSPCY